VKIHKNYFGYATITVKSLIAKSSIVSGKMHLCKMPYSGKNSFVEEILSANSVKQQMTGRNNRNLHPKY
jgi:hypothetical protein